MTNVRGVSTSPSDADGGPEVDVLVATGPVGGLPDVPGLREWWGRDVVHCPSSFGWDFGDEPLGVLSTGPWVVGHPLGIGYQVNADPTGLAAPGVHVAGNLTDVTVGIGQAAASGVTTVAAINADPTAEDTAHAVLARKLTR